MWKLIKYELRKQMQSKAIIFGIVALLEIVWFWGLFMNENLLISTSGFLFVAANISMLYLYFESIVTFSNDLKTKNSYMLFMTPNSSYKIIGAKVLASGIQIIVYGLCFFGIGVLDLGIMAIRIHSVAEIIELIKTFLREAVQIDVNVTYVLISILSLLIVGIFILVLAYLSITLSATFLANKAYKGIISFAIFVLILFVVEKIASAVLGNILLSDGTTIILSILWYAAMSIAAYVATAWMLEKRVSL